jgi:hypothetical protein
MTAADRARLVVHLKAQARYRWRRMEAALAAGDRTTYEWHQAWRSAITKELGELTDPIFAALQSHPLTRTSP